MSNHHSSSCHNESCHDPSKRDWLFILSTIAIAISYSLAIINYDFGIPVASEFNQKTFAVMNEMWWSLIISFFAVGFLNLVPQSTVMKYMGTHRGLNGLLRAVGAGVLFDLCSHGILLVGMKLYERGATLGQTMAFLIASPWNSFSLTIIMISLIGLKATLLFLVLSLIIAFVSGVIFDLCVKQDILRENKNEPVQNKNGKEEKFHFEWNPKFIFNVIIDGIGESKMILKWVFIGVLLSSLVAVAFDPETFSYYFGKSLRGMGLTLLGATIIEVCSEGSIPLAADLVNVAGALGNAFIFLMAGVATDFTEFMAIRETMKSWKIAIFLPLITVPQILLFGYLINFLGN